MPIIVTIIEPDQDDQNEGKWKTRANTDGRIRGKVEAEVMDVEPGKQYTIQVIVTEIGAAPQEGATPQVTAQPPR